MGNIFTKKCKLCNITYNKHNSVTCRGALEKYNEYIIIDNKKCYIASHQYEGGTIC